MVPMLIPSLYSQAAHLLNNSSLTNTATIQIVVQILLMLQEELYQIVVLLQIPYGNNHEFREH